MKTIDMRKVVTKWKEDTSYLIFLEEVLITWEQLQNDMYSRKSVPETIMEYKTDGLEIKFVGDTQSKTVSALYNYRNAKQTAFTKAIWNALMKECILRIRNHSNTLMTELEPWIGYQGTVEKAAKELFKNELESRIDSALQEKHDELKAKVEGYKKFISLNESGVAGLRRVQEESESKRKMYMAISQALKAFAFTLMFVSVMALALHFYVTLVKTTS